MFQRIADQVVLSFFSLLYSGAVRLLRLRRDPLTAQRTTQPGAAGS
jgi:hypothetical protein